MAKKRNTKLSVSLLDLSQQETSKVALLEEKFQALHHKIHQLQCIDMLKKKVQFVLLMVVLTTRICQH